MEVIDKVTQFYDPESVQEIIELDIIETPKTIEQIRSGEIGILHPLSYNVTEHQFGDGVLIEPNPLTMTGIWATVEIARHVDKGHPSENPIIVTTGGWQELNSLQRPVSHVSKWVIEQALGPRFHVVGEHNLREGGERYSREVSEELMISLIGALNSESGNSPKVLVIASAHHIPRVKLLSTKIPHGDLIEVLSAEAILLFLLNEGLMPRTDRRDFLDERSRLYREELVKYLLTLIDYRLPSFLMGFDRIAFNKEKSYQSK